MTKNVRIAISAGCFAVLFIAAFLLANRGVYGWTLFIVLPVIAGALGSWSLRPKTAGQATRIGATIGALGCGLFLLAGVEGFVCVLMALPVVVPLAIAGSLLAYWDPRRPTAMALLLPMSLFFDVNAKAPIYSVTTSMVVNAAPERVWKNVVAFPDIAAEPDWVLRSGPAYPIRTRIGGSGSGAPRNCELSTGAVQERVVVWDEPRRLRFVVTATPPAMTERGLYGPIDSKHLHGYYIAREGEFALTALPGGRTLVVGTSWYQHGLWPAEYWRWWSDMVVHHVHQRVLNHVRWLSENDVEFRNALSH